MSFFSTLKTALSLKEKLAATGVLVLICALVGAGFVWERHQLKQAIEKIGSIDQAVKERDKSIKDLNQTIETMNKAEQHFHSQEVKNESEQAKYADRQMERKAEVQKQLVAAGNVRKRIPANPQRLLPESTREFNANAAKG
ncbi:ppfA [Escherichia coli]|uniref:ppfA n=1 Tax=Escherichia coli TaxID=562 RepID=UPI0010ABA9E4|nr:ppfA [Escherichia coli]TJN32409.1 ppfA [Escherichia coli]